MSYTISQLRKSLPFKVILEDNFFEEFITIIHGPDMDGAYSYIDHLGCCGILKIEDVISANWLPHSDIVVRPLGTWTFKANELAALDNLERNEQAHFDNLDNYHDEVLHDV